MAPLSQIRFFKAACKTGAKFHFTVGHTTVMGTATFFGPPQDPLVASQGLKAEGGMSKADEEAALARTVQLARTPLAEHFDESAEYEWFEQLDPESADMYPVRWFEPTISVAHPGRSASYAPPKRL